MVEDRIPTFCVPHAGAGASFFQQWSRLGIGGLDVRSIQLPGREERIDEDPYTEIGAAVAGLEPALLAAVPEPATVALFGHSLGAVLAYELARRLERRPGLTVARLFVSGSPGPWLSRSRRATGLDDENFILRVQEFAGYRHAAFDIPELRELILPTLRADVHLHENYTPLLGPRLRAPITCVRGDRDDLVSRAQCQGWFAATDGGFEFLELPGGHMFLTDRAEDLLGIMSDRLVPVPSSGR